LHHRTMMTIDGRADKPLSGGDCPGLALARRRSASMCRRGFSADWVAGERLAVVVR
jgi:hypothetical protein